jgi:proteasome lid subunit RPN8/RPN11
MEIKIYRSVLSRFIQTVKEEYPKKVFGYFLSNNKEAIATSFYLFNEDSRQETEVSNRFLKLGKYYENNKNAGFLSTFEETFRFEKFLVGNHLREVGVFHAHLRHPPFFSVVDLKLHPTPLLWHLIISVRNSNRPTLGGFEITGEWFKNKEIQIVDDETGNTKNYSDSLLTGLNFSERMLRQINNLPEGVKVLSDLLYFKDLPSEIKVRLLEILKNSEDKEKQKLYLKWKEDFKVNLKFDYAEYEGNLIAKSTVTNYQYKQVFPNYEFITGKENYPVVNVSWYDAKLFSELTDTQLISENYWEILCEDKIMPDDWEQYNPQLMEVAVYSENSDNHLNAVCTKKPNSKGIFDLQGNTWEWCDSDESSNSSATKGGSYFSFPEMCRSRVKQVEIKDFYAKDISFRIMKGKKK